MHCEDDFLCLMINCEDKLNEMHSYLVPLVTTLILCDLLWK